MSAPEVWISQHTSDKVAWVSEVTNALRREGVIAHPEPEERACGAGIILFNRVDDQLCEEIARQSVRGAIPVFAVAGSAQLLARGAVWKLLASGAAEILTWERSPNLAAMIAARLARLLEVKKLLDSPLIKENLPGQSPAWLKILRQVAEMARFTDASILITGESGTGKELIARLVHTLDTRPDKGRLVVLDCTTVVPELSGSEFFGHERGAFTHAIAARDGAFALADKGSLFLDEVGELPPSLQAELLRVVQERTYKRVGSNTWQPVIFRLVCATNRDLLAEEARGNFRRDFYHRIASWTCHLPALCERREDILPLARHFLQSVLDRPAETQFDPAVEDFLLARDYPGNVRELRQLVFRIGKRHVGPGPITVGDIPEEDRVRAVELMQSDWTEGAFQNALRRALSSGANLPEIKEKTAEVVIQLALQDAGGNLRRAALKLGVTDRALQMRRAAQRFRDADHLVSGNGHQNLV